MFSDPQSNVPFHGLSNQLSLGFWATSLWKSTPSTRSTKLHNAGEEDTAGEENTGGEASIDSEAEKEERRFQVRRRREDLKRRQTEGVATNVPIDLLRRLGPVSSKFNISHCAASEIIASVYKECNIALNLVVLSENSSKRLRPEDNEQIAEEVLQKFGEEVREKKVAVTVHFDTKFMKQRMDKKRSEKDRLVVTVTGDKLEKSQLLGVPALEGSSAIDLCNVGGA